MVYPQGRTLSPHGLTYQFTKLIVGVLLSILYALETLVKPHQIPFPIQKSSNPPMFNKVASLLHQYQEPSPR